MYRLRRAAEANPAVSLWALIGLAVRHGGERVTFVPAEPLGAFVAWIEQLLATSVSKESRALAAVVDEPLDAPEVYGADRAFESLRLAKDENSVRESSSPLWRRQAIL